MPSCGRKGSSWGRTAACFRAGGIAIETSLRGRFNVENVLGAVAASILLGIDDDEIAAGVAAAPGVPGRFEAIDAGQPFTVIVDYAHTPDSLDIVLQAARELTDGRLIVVFGAGGDRDRGKRPLMGRVARERSDLAIVTSDNPRSEDPIAIIQDVLQGAGVDVEIDPDRRSAITRALTVAERGRRRRRRRQGPRAGAGGRGRRASVRRPRGRARDR